ncbi:hypothetical protein MPSEU_000181500 [Mayamaea pseudoterrestris]|nr:hypothetical protein MPSEU_000181500 [Mayamaea pseudoterrestris]
MLILTILLFTLDTKSYAWTLTAGTLGGPAVVMIAPTVLYWLDPPSQTSTTPSPLAQKQSSQLIAMAYGASGVVSLLGWYFLLYVAWTRYETNVAAFLSDVWGATSNPFVRFMTIDALVLWLAVLIHIGFRNVGSAVEAVLLTPLFGPGAACAMALSGVETMEEQKLKRD